MACILVLPFTVHAFQAYGGYDGEHCAGLLDATWKCTELEYYLDWMFGTFSIGGLFLNYLVALPIAVILASLNKWYFDETE